MEKKVIKQIVLFLLIVSITLGGSEGDVRAQTISGTNQSSISHGDSITITGLGFGIKNPAAPAIWKTFESGTVSEEWDGYMPSTAGTAYNMQYRTMPYRNVDVPHSSGGNTKCMVGGHDPGGYPQVGSGTDGPNVRVRKSVGGSRELYITYYGQLDPLWPIENDNRHGHGICDTSASSFWCAGSSGSMEVGRFCSTGEDGYLHGNSVCYDDDDNLCECCINDGGLRASHLIPWAVARAWHREEFLTKIDSSTGFAKTLINNIEKYSGTNCNIGSYNIGQVEIGDFWRKTNNPETGDGNAFVYYDDIYLDTTFSRVILTNNPTYENATIIEVQIPTAWSNESIKATTHLGKLNGSTAYLFVFDANNTHNDVGFEVTLGGESATAPTRSNPSPTGTLDAGTTSASISLKTNIQATCRYSDISGINYTDMLNTFTYTNSTNHSALATGLENGKTYVYYVRCNSTGGYVNEDDWNITFSIDGHNADTNDDGVISMKELIMFIARWKVNDGVSRQEVLDARGIWFSGGVY